MADKVNPIYDDKRKAVLRAKRLAKATGTSQNIWQVMNGGVPFYKVTNFTLPGHYWIQRVDPPEDEADQKQEGGS